MIILPITEGQSYFKDFLTNCFNRPDLRYYVLHYLYSQIDTYLFYSMRISVATYYLCLLFRTEKKTESHVA